MLIIGVSEPLTSLCAEFESWHNAWRPYVTLEGLRSDDVYCRRKPETPKRDSKAVPASIEHHVCLKTRLSAHRLKTAL